MISILTASGYQDWKEKFKIFINFYEDDLPDPLALDGELDLWQSYWENIKVQGLIVLLMLPHLSI